MENTKKLTIEEWEAKFKPIINPNAEDECCAERFETYGEDLEFVVNTANATPKKVWTLEDLDGQLIICAGLHLVNRINYFITEEEWDDENIEVQYCDEDITTKLQSFNATGYTTRELLEMEFQNVPNGAQKENLIAEALQLVEECAYTVGEAANEVKVAIVMTGLPLLSDIKEHFLTFVGEWSTAKECRTGENRADGTVSYNQDGLYLYEFHTREDAFNYLFEDVRSVPFAIAEYDEEAFGEWEFHNEFNPLWIDSKRA